MFAVRVKRSVHPDGMSRNLGRCPSISTIVEKSGRKCPYGSTIVEKLGRCAHLVRRSSRNLGGMCPFGSRSLHKKSVQLHTDLVHCTRNRCTFPIELIGRVTRNLPTVDTLRNFFLIPPAEMLTVFQTLRVAAD